MFCLLETTIHFVHATSFYFDQRLLQYSLQYESYSYNIWNNYFIISWNYILLLPFFHCVFYTCLLAVRRASARQAALSYLVVYMPPNLLTLVWSKPSTGSQHNMTLDWMNTEDIVELNRSAPFHYISISLVSHTHKVDNGFWCRLSHTSEARKWKTLMGSRIWSVC
jgi:hypothetical protein